MDGVITRKIIRIYKAPISICLFIALFSFFHWLKPDISYLPNGSYRPFGVGYRHKTILPVWLVAIALAIISYLFTLFLLTQM
jgi:hypothetical protein